MINKSHYSDIKWVLTQWGEFPSFYSDNACRIIGDKYFAKDEESWFDVVKRVVTEIAKHGRDHGYFEAPGSAGDYAVALGDLLLHQHVSFNSPVWFNLGVEDDPQCSACFIQSVDDSIEGISALMTKEARIFKQGSGTGTNISTIRAKGATLSGGGQASGPLSFMKAFDANAGAIKSGGKTRRSAKMVLMDCDHADIGEFIWSKAVEDRKARKAIESGTDPQQAYEDVWYQNGNHSVRLSDAFMERAISGWEDEPSHEADMLDAIAQAAWECGDPGVQFSTTINDDNPCKKDFRINASNPCSEYLFMDESACNLASIKLSPYTDNSMYYVSSILIKAMDIIVSLSNYPTEEIDTNSEKYRPLGLGFSNLGAYLMELGLHYDSTKARAKAHDLSERMLMAAQQESKLLAQQLGSNWDSGEAPLRNAQLTLIAPTGTISFGMDCDSTGCEPVFAEEQIKNLSGGGQLVIVPDCVQNADPSSIATAIGEHAITPKAHIDMMEAIQPSMSGAISKTVNMPATCTPQDIRDMIVYAWEGGIKCVAFYRDGSKGIQPLEEKPTERYVPTLNEVLNAADHDDMESVLQGEYQFVVNPPTATSGTREQEKFYAKPMKELLFPGGLGNRTEARKKLPATRTSKTHKFCVGGVSGYLTVGLYDDGTPGEVFVNVSKQGSTVAGLVDAWATAFSLCLQYGVPLAKLCDKFKGTRFEPAGFTGTETIRSATSLLDYVCQWLEFEYVGAPMNVILGETYVADPADVSGTPCPECGTIMQQTGTCWACPACAHSTGGCG